MDQDDVYDPSCWNFVIAPSLAPPPPEPAEDSSEVVVDVAFELDTVNYQQLIHGPVKKSGLITIHAPRQPAHGIVKRVPVALLLFFYPKTTYLSQDDICDLLRWCDSVFPSQSRIAIAVDGASPCNLVPELRGFIQSHMRHVKVEMFALNYSFASPFDKRLPSNLWDLKNWCQGCSGGDHHATCVFISPTPGDVHRQFQQDMRAIMGISFSVGIFQVDTDHVQERNDSLLQFVQVTNGHYHNVGGMKNLTAAVGLYLCQEVLDVAMENVELRIEGSLLPSSFFHEFFPYKLEMPKLTLKGRSSSLRGNYTKVDLPNMAYGSRHSIGFDVELSLKKLRYDVPEFQNTLAPNEIFGMRKEAKGESDESNLDSCLLCLEEGHPRLYSCSRDQSRGVCRFAICADCEAMIEQLPRDQDGRAKCPHCNITGSIWKGSDILPNDLVVTSANVAITHNKILPAGYLGRVCVDQSNAKQRKDVACKYWLVTFHVRPDKNDDNANNKKHDLQEFTVLLPETIISARGPSWELEAKDEVCILANNGLGIKPGYSRDLSPSTPT